MVYLAYSGIDQSHSSLISFPFAVVGIVSAPAGVVPSSERKKQESKGRMPKGKTQESDSCVHQCQREGVVPAERRGSRWESPKTREEEEKKKRQT